MHHTPISFGHINPGLNFKEMFRLPMSSYRGVSHIGLCAVLLVREKIKYPFPAACSSHRALPTAVGLLLSSRDSPFILLVASGAPALPETFVPSLCLAGRGLPHMGAVAASLP